MREKLRMGQAKDNWVKMGVERKKKCSMPRELMEGKSIKLDLMTEKP